MVSRPNPKHTEVIHVSYKPANRRPRLEGVAETQRGVTVRFTNGRVYTYRGPRPRLPEVAERLIALMRRPGGVTDLGVRHAVRAIARRPLTGEELRRLG